MEKSKIVTRNIALCLQSNSGASYLIGTFSLTKIGYTSLSECFDSDFNECSSD